MESHLFNLFILAIGPLLTCWIMGGEDRVGFRVRVSISVMVKVRY